ncbi:MAG: ParB/RepB/Spo0J family partition protein [bacterium]|nr:ParB/RepB/Spo0J family partition protein [bacterium]
MATRKALGRGLSALIPQTPTPRPEVAEVAEIKKETPEDTAPLYLEISSIHPNPNQPRKAFVDQDLNTLAASIREQGILQPLVVRRQQHGYELIIGERRWRASQLAGLDEVPVVVLDASDRQVVEMALVENVQRADLNPIELAEAFRVLIENEGMTQEQVGRRVGLDRSSVANNLRLLELDREIQQDVIDGNLTLGHAKAVLQVPQSHRKMVRDQIVRGALSVRGAEELGRRIASNTGGKTLAKGPTRDIHIVDLEDNLRKELRTKVRVIGRPGKGRIELHYFGEGELDRLADLLLGG